MLKSFVFSFVLLITMGAFSQPFSSEPEAFLKEITKYLNISDRAKTKVFIEEFGPFWLNEFPMEYRVKVVATSNLIVEKKLSAYPNLQGYLLSTYSFVKTKQPQESFDSWHATIDKLLKSKKVKKFKTFIETCSGFFTDGTIYSNTRHIWGIRGGSYRFEFEKNNPKIYFEDATFYCYIKNKSTGKKNAKYTDSTVVYATDGEYQPLIFKWNGDGGIVDWAKTGLDPTKNFATITDYSLSLKATKIQCDSVEVHTDFYEKPLKGTFIDFARATTRQTDRIYPQFISFSKKIVKRNILPNIDYIGGFSLTGNSFTGVGYENELASLLFYEDGKTFLKASANRFTVNKKGVKAIECKVTMYLNETDSLFHPGVTLNYDTKKVELTRTKNGIGQAPFSDTYHQLDMFVEKIIWSKGESNLDLTWEKGSNKKLASFESKNYFNDRLYTKLQGMSRMHPIVALYKHYYKYDEATFSIAQASTLLGLTNESALSTLLDLANKGFVSYNKSQKTVTVLPKCKVYIDAKSGKSDYDDIVFYSDFNEIKSKPMRLPDGSKDKTAESWNLRAKKLNNRKKNKQSFGIMNLKTLDLKLNEIEYVELSVIQRVVVIPKDGELVIQDNRNFLFSGAVSAGKLETYPKDATFDYDNFKINLLDVSQTLLRVRPIFGGYDNLVDMPSHIEGVKGVILIDHPKNKSGNKKQITDYPKLRVKNNAYVFYDHKAIYNGTYDSASFYFKLDPFSIDSLDNFDEHSIQLAGEFRSSGIFPVFKESITIQEDYSFGFKTVSPDGGYRFYGQDAKYNNDIRLSNNGLRGSGEIDFLTSHTESKDFVFFADSTMGLSEFTNKGQTKSEGLEVPDVMASGAMVTYIPKKNLLKTKAQSAPLYLFNKEVDMHGETWLSPQGMTGKGLMYFGQAELSSRHFKYERWIIDSDTTDFNLADVDGENASNADDISFATNNVNSHVDFETRRGEFKSNDGTSKVDFPINQYYCYMDMFTWKMDDGEMELSKNDNDLNLDSELDLAGSNFYSTNNKQDSLNFRAPKATFSLKDKIIDCDKIEYIDIADARISPTDKKIIIRKKAKMDPFENATIVANFVTKYHTINNAYVEIFARRKYEAKGEYLYIDANKNEYKIAFNSIHPDTVYQTVATGKISQEENFKLSEQFEYYGQANLNASNEFLNFDGATRITHECDQFARNWMKFKADIDPNNIQIPVGENMKDLDGNDIAVGMILRTTSDSDSLGIYPTFLSSLENKKDRVLFTSNGVLNYNADASEYRIAAQDKLINRAEKGNYISLHTQSCSMNGDGLINLHVNLPDVEFKPIGTVNYNASTRKMTLNISGGLDFFYDEKALLMNSEKILETEELTGIDFNTITLEQAIKEDVNKETAEKIKSDYTLKGEVKKVPKEMQKPFYFTNLRFTWDDRSKAFLSKPITGIVNMGDKPIYKDFTVKMAIQYSVEDSKQKGRGDKLSYMIELPGAKHYYYHFERIQKETRLQVFTNDEVLKEYIFSLKDDKRKQKKLSFDYSSKTIYLTQFRSLFGE
jgi:hypothetical protein